MGKILVFGSTGFLGSYLIRYLSKTSQVYKVERVNQSNLFMVKVVGPTSRSITFKCNKNSVSKMLSRIKPDVIFNAAAMANIEQCASAPELSYLINANLPEWISIYSSNNNCKLVHFSTDAVYGQVGSRFTELETPNPKSIYGKSKLEGEFLVSSKDRNALILRTNFFGWSSKKISLFNFFYNELSQDRTVKGFTNIVFTPIYVNDLIEIADYLVKNGQFGLFHVTGNEIISKYEFGQAIAISLNKEKKLVKPELMQNNNLDTTRGHDISLDNSKVKALIGTIPHYTLGIEQLVNQRKKENKN